MKLQLFCILRPFSKNWKFSCTSYYCFCVSLLLTDMHAHTHTALTPNKVNTCLGLELFPIALHFAIKKRCVENNNMALASCWCNPRPLPPPHHLFLALPFVVYRSKLFFYYCFIYFCLLPLQLLLMFLFCCYIFLSLISNPQKNPRRAFCLLLTPKNGK